MGLPQDWGGESKQNGRFPNRPLTRPGVRPSRTGSSGATHFFTDTHHTKSFSCFVGTVSVIFVADTKGHVHITSNKEVVKGA